METELSEDILKGERLPVMEAFYTIQGEGFYQGSAAYFIRLAGCDVGCPWCDVKESWETDGYPVLSVAELVEKAAAFPAKIVVITGGEPMKYDLGPLTKALQAAGKRTHVETSGAHELSGVWDWVCFSPKKMKVPLPSVINAADELKVVVFNKSDYRWAAQFKQVVPDSCRLYLQPEWSKADTITAEIIEYVKDNPQWEISLQMHKFMNIP